MRLVLIRHGEVSWAGASDDDPPLTPAGHEQARLLGRRFQGQTLDRLYCSPMVRARQTADYVARAVSLVPVILPWLREIHCPLLTDEEVERMEARPLDRWWDGFPGGEETFREFHRRVASGMDRLLEELGARLGPVGGGGSPGSDERIGLVSHAGVSSVLVGHLMGIEPVPWEWYRFGMGFTGVTHVRLRPLGESAIATLTLFNCRRHLDP